MSISVQLVICILLIIVFVGFSVVARRVDLCEKKSSFHIFFITTTTVLVNKLFFFKYFGRKIPKILANEWP